MSRVCKTPSEFPAGFYWNGGQRINYGTYPCWINDISLENDDDTNSQEHTRYYLRSGKLEHMTTQDELSSKGGVM